MNATKLFLEKKTLGVLSHVRGASAQVSRTAEELSQNVANLARALTRHGIVQNDAVLVLCSSRVEAVEVILAVMNVGAIAMPVTPLLGINNIVSIISRIRPRCCVFEDPPEPAIQQALGAMDSLMITLRPLLEAVQPHWLSYLALVEAQATDRALAFASFADDHPCLVIHGSGSSGSPKAVQMTHGAMMRFFEYHNFLYSQYSDGPDTLTGSSAMVTGLPVTHLAGLATCLQGLMNDRPTYLLSHFIPEAYLRLIETARCAFILLVPSLYRTLLRESYLQGMDRSALRFCITGGEPCAPELASRIEAAFGVPLVTAYSMTECLSGLGHSRADLFARRTKSGSCGRQLFGESRLFDNEGREQAAFGELWVRNATVNKCYLDSALNAKHLRGRWFRTGDLFAKDEDGDYFHSGRVDDMFICNGKNIYPVEIELLLMQHPAVEAACGVSVATSEQGVVVGALIVARHPVSRAEIQEFMIRRGPSHVVPQIIGFAKSLPQIGPGKLDRHRAAQQLREQVELVVGCQ
jgi:fatty-acyl-CoA synthase